MGKKFNSSVCVHIYIYIYISTVKVYSHVGYYYVMLIGDCKAIQLQAWTGPVGSRKLRFPDFMTTAQDGGKVVSLTHR